MSKYIHIAHDNSVKAEVGRLRRAVRVMIPLTFAERYQQARTYAAQVRTRKAMGDRYEHFNPRKLRCVTQDLSTSAAAHSTTAGSGNSPPTASASC